jgi:hypothetical protein
MMSVDEHDGFGQVGHLCTDAEPMSLSLALDNIV